MKNIAFYLAGIIPLFLITSCSDPELDVGLPDNLISSTVRAETLHNIQLMFHEQKSLKDSLPVLFELSSEKRILLSKTSEVYVTFVSEGASYQNSFGYYTYNADAVPTNAALLDLHILFPNVDELILKRGDMVQVGTTTFPAGTIIGFFVIVNGWQGESVHMDREKLYTDLGLNPDGDQQHVLFKLKNFGDIVLGFEDIPVSAPGHVYSDYNDIIFTVSDNKVGNEVTNFNLNNVIRL
ncbi:MAG: DUF4114 domain-containing protein [Cyclobacteriaceae bacterium]